MAGIGIAIAIVFVIFLVIVFACAVGFGAWLWKESPGTLVCIAAFIALCVMWAYAMGSDAAVARLSACSAVLLLLHAIGCYYASRADESDTWHRFFFYFNAGAAVVSAACWSLAVQGDNTAVGLIAGLVAIYASLATVGFGLRVSSSAF